MYIKEIKIYGFKSFADKLTIELDPTFTGIVGPNGSGKSNIVDAIKWVLGEQRSATAKNTTSVSRPVPSRNCMRCLRTWTILIR